MSCHVTASRRRQKKINTKPNYMQDWKSVLCQFLCTKWGLLSLSMLSLHFGTYFIRPFFLAYRPILPFKVPLSHADRGRKKASPTPKNRIGSAQLCYSTCCTWIGVAHPSTNQAQHCLTSVIEWELVFQCGYGRRAPFLTYLVSSF